MKIKYIPGIMIILSLTISGCSKSNDKLTYAYQDRIVDTLSVVAVEKELLSDNIDSRIFSSGPQTVEALISGSADVAAMGDSTAIILLSKYDNFVIIASHGNGPQRHRIIASNSVLINDWDDLHGKKIGIKKGTSTYGGFLLKAKEQGIDLNMELIDLSPGDQLTALASGQIDLMIASEPTPSIAEFKTIGYHFSSLDTGEMTYPIVLVTTKDVLVRKKQYLEELFESLVMAEDYLASNYSEVVKIHSFLNDFPEELVEKSMSLHRYELQNPKMIYNTMNTLSEVLLGLEKIERIPLWDEALVPDLFKDYKK